MVHGTKRAREGTFKAPLLQKCFKVGDLVEAMYSDGCWVPGKVMATRARHVLVQYEKEQAELSSPEQFGPRHICYENETPRDVARTTGVPVSVLLALNLNRYPGLVATSKLRESTFLVLPELHVCGDEDTPRIIAERFGRDLDTLLQQNAPTVPALQTDSLLSEGTVLVLPPPAEEMQTSAVSAGDTLPPQLGVMVEVDDALVCRHQPSGSSGRGSAGTRWHLAEVKRLLPYSRFAVVLRPLDQERRTGTSLVQEQETAVVEINALGLDGEGREWRRVASGGATAIGRPSEVGCELEVGSEMEVEVGDKERARWRSSEVRALLSNGRFLVCVDGDEDFLEEFGPDDEGVEWRRKPAKLPPDRCASEWTVHELVRPRLPSAPDDFLHAVPPPTTVQVWQDDGWWRAQYFGMAASKVDPITSEKLPAPAEQETFLCAILKMGQRAVVLRVTAPRIRPDLVWQREGWAVASAPKQLLIPLAAASAPTAVSVSVSDAQIAPLKAAAGARGWRTRLTLLASAAPAGRLRRARWAPPSNLQLAPAADLEPKLWAGASEQGWLVVEARGGNDGQMHYFAPARPSSEMPQDSFHVDESHAQGCQMHARASPEMQGAEEAGNESMGKLSADAAAVLGMADAAEAQLPNGTCPGAVVEAQLPNLAGPGAVVEAQLADVLYRGGWWDGTVEECGLGGAVVRTHAFSKSKGAGSTEQLAVTVPWSQLRLPAPLTTLEEHARPGGAVELWWEGGWWEATMWMMVPPSIATPCEPSWPDSHSFEDGSSDGGKSFSGDDSGGYSTGGDSSDDGDVLESEDPDSSDDGADDDADDDGCESGDDAVESTLSQPTMPLVIVTRDVPMPSRHFVPLSQLRPG